MSHRLHKTFLQRVVSLAGRPGEADAELLRRYSDHQDEAAFVELHRRHGPLVWAACRHLLPNQADAEDAYQVTFLALVKSAGRVRNGSALGAWLHGVAVRTAARLKRSAVRRRTREERVATNEADQPVPEAAWTGLLAAVHEEVERLPTQLRTAFVLCDLQGVRQPDAAARLGWKPGTLTGRLTKARHQLTQSLKERGIAPALAAGALGVAVTAAGATLVPAPIMGMVHNYAAGAAVAPAFLQQLAGEMMVMRHTKWFAAGLAVVAALGLWLGSFTLPSAGGQPTQDRFTGEASQDSDSTRNKYYDRVAKNQAELPRKGSPTHYKYVPLAEGQTADTFFGTVIRLESEAKGGWEYCGSLDMSLRRHEYQALLAGKMPDGTAKNDEREAVYRVLVFKRSVQALQAREELRGPQDHSIIPLKRSNASEIADILQRFYGPDPKQRVVADSRTNTLIIKGDEATIARIRKLVEQLDRQDDAVNPGLPGSKLPVLPPTKSKKPSADKEPEGGANLPPLPTDADVAAFRLKHTSASEMAKLLYDLYRGKRGPNIHIVADPTTNSLMVQADKETMAEVRRVLQVLDTELRKKDAGVAK